MKIFVTGSDTGIGKTHTSRLLVEAWDRRFPNRPLTPLKPIVSGGDEDWQELSAATSGRLQPTDVGFQSWATAATPSVAAALENQPLDLDQMLQWCCARSAQGDTLLEAVGGWMAPIQGTWCVADWAEKLGWPVLLIVGNRLGALNPTLLTAQDLARRGLTLAGIILNDPQPDLPEFILQSNARVLSEDFGLPVWGRLHFGARSIPHTWCDQLAALSDPGRVL
jgi:dethiobiotin synthetase